MNEQDEPIILPAPVALRMVKGSPLDVEIETNRLLNEGFVFHGEMFQWTLPGELRTIFVQPMVKYDFIELVETEDDE